MADSGGRVRIEQGVVFGSGGGRDLACDVYTPPDPEAAAPGVLLLHGGGWWRGERAAMRGYGIRLALAGFVCAASEYRLTGESAWPAQIHDVKAALRWMRARSGDLGIDPGRIAVQGSSAGAHLGLFAAGTPDAEDWEGAGGNPDESSRVAAVVGIYTPTVFHHEGPRPSGAVPAAALLGPAATAESARTASPIAWVDKSFPPTFLLHGSADRVVPPSASQRMYEALVAARVPVELHMYADQPHGFARQPAFLKGCAAEIASFFRRYLHTPSTDPQ